MSRVFHLARHWRFLVALAVLACWVIALFSLKVAFDGMRCLVPPGTVLTDAERVALESRSQYTTIERRLSPDDVHEVHLSDRRDGSSDFENGLVYRPDGVVSKSSISGKWKLRYRLRVAAIAGAAGGLLCLLAFRQNAYPLLALSAGCAALFFTTTPFDYVWLRDVWQERHPGVAMVGPSAVLPAGLGGRLEVNCSDVPRPHSSIAWRLEYFLNGYCADTEIHAYAVQTNVRWCCVVLGGLVAWQLIGVMRAIWIWRSNVARQGQLPRMEGAEEQLRCTPCVPAGSRVSPWKRRFWLFVSLGAVAIVAWRYKVLNDRLTEMKYHALKIAADGAWDSQRWSALFSALIRSELIDVRENLPIFIRQTKAQRQAQVDYLNLMVRRGLIDQKDADKAVGFYNGEMDAKE